MFTIPYDTFLETALKDNTAEAHSSTHLHTKSRKSYIVWLLTPTFHVLMSTHRFLNSLEHVERPTEVAVLFMSIQRPWVHYLLHIIVLLCSGDAL